ncbi:hypothetical protein PGO_146230 [Plasmodium gonderi]|uniref:Vacuolar protein sorting-associated protein 54 C-terminal domain-containing protein n=1 Tax=Plasmodium gonderi TaxID=77519 RepID=A0A1Y1JQP1_PLAGO|nr:hypothetical protein PGO_146230 [Plasmodium gonderi]GAW83825.1 hypothetical protein PGO_146230 [Plasmodium gonderi]
MDKQKKTNVVKENPWLKHRHSLIHISNVVKNENIQENRNGNGSEIEKYEDKSNEQIYGSLPTPDLEKINIRDFDQYIHYITKINTLNDVNIHNVDEINLDHFENVLKNPSKYIEIRKCTENFSQRGATNWDNLDTINHLSSCDHFESQWKKDYDSFFSDDSKCNMSTLVQEQKVLIENLDTIDRSINVLISKDFQNYLHIITVMKNIRNEIESTHDEIKSLKTHVNDIKGMLLKNIHLKKHNDLKKKCIKVNYVLKKFMYFQTLLKVLKKSLQKNKIYHCLAVVNKIFKIYNFFRKFFFFQYFQKYFSNFNILYLKNFISQNFLFSFFYYTLLFLFRSKRRKGHLYSVHKLNKCLRHYLVRPNDWNHLQGSNRSLEDEAIHRSNKTRCGFATTRESNIYMSYFNSNFDHTLPKNRKSCDYASKDTNIHKSENQREKKKIKNFVKFHKLMNKEFMRLLYREKKKIIKYKKRKNDVKFFVKQWNYTSNTYFCKKRNKKFKMDEQISQLNKIFTPSLLFNNFFDSLKRFCRNQNYFIPFVDNLFYQSLSESILLMQCDQICHIPEETSFGEVKGNKPDGSSTIEGENFKPEGSPTIEGENFKLDRSNIHMENMLDKHGTQNELKYSEWNKDIQSACKNRMRLGKEKKNKNQCYERGKIHTLYLLSEKKGNTNRHSNKIINSICEYLVIKKCKRKKNFEFHEKETINMLHRHIGLFPTVNLMHFLNKFFSKIKIVYSNINKWTSFLIRKTITVILDDAYMNTFKIHIPFLISHGSYFQLVKKKKFLNMMKHVFIKYWKNYQNIQYFLFNKFLEKLNDILNERKKYNLHLGINQMISMHRTILPIFLFIHRKRYQLRKIYLHIFLLSIFSLLRNKRQAKHAHKLISLSHKNPTNVSRLYKQPIRNNLVKKSFNVRICLTKNFLTLIKKVTLLNCISKRRNEQKMRIRKNALVSLYLWNKTKHQTCETHIGEDNLIMERSNDETNKIDNQFDKHTGKNLPVEEDPLREYHQRYLPSTPYKNLCVTNSLLISNQLFYLSVKRRKLLLRLEKKKKKKKQQDMVNFIKIIKRKTMLKKNFKFMHIPDEKKYYNKITKYIKSESIIAINNFYEFKNIQMHKSLELEKWNILDDIPYEVNTQLEKYFKIKNKDTNKLLINNKLYYLTNSSISFLCILFQYVHFMLSLPLISNEIVTKVLNFYDKQFFTNIHHFIINGHAVTNSTLKSITIKILALVINTVDFTESILIQIYSIWYKLGEFFHRERKIISTGNSTNTGVVTNVITDTNTSMHNGMKSRDIKLSQCVQNINSQCIDKDSFRTPNGMIIQILGDVKTDSCGNKILTTIFPETEQKTHNPFDTSSRDKNCKSEKKNTGKGEKNSIYRNNVNSINHSEIMIPIKISEKHISTEMLQDVKSHEVSSVFVGYKKCITHFSKLHRYYIPHDIKLFRQEWQNASANFKRVLDKSFLLRKKLSQKIVDILSTRFDYYTNIWLASDNMIKNQIVNSLNYECDILPYGMQLRSTCKLLTTYLPEEDTKSIYRELFQDIVNRFSLRINVLKGNDKYKQVITRLLQDHLTEKSEIDQLILHYYNYEFKAKITHIINKNVGDKIIIDITNVLIILYKIPFLCEIIETFLNDFLQICKSHWYVTIDPFVILSKKCKK